MEYNIIYPYLDLLLYAMAFDVLTGILVSIANKALNSDICGKGMRKKAAMLILVLAAYTFQRLTGDAPIGLWLALSFTLAEMISIMENAILLGAPVPDSLRNVFLDLKDASENMFRVGDSPRKYEEIQELRKSAIDPIETIIDETVK